jgi:hypothetical protein
VTPAEGMKDTKGKGKAIEAVEDDEALPFVAPPDSDDEPILVVHAKSKGNSVDVAKRSPLQKEKGSDLDVVEEDEGSPFPFRPTKKLRVIEPDNEEEAEGPSTATLLQAVARGKMDNDEELPFRVLGESDDEPIVISHTKGKEKAVEVVDDDEWSLIPSRPTKRARIIESDDEGETEEPSQTSLYINPLTLPMLDTQITTSEEGSSQLTNHRPDLVRSTSPLTPIEEDKQEIGHDPPAEPRVPSVEWDCGVETALPWFEEVKGSGVNLLQKVGFFIPFPFSYVTFK